MTNRGGDWYVTGMHRLYADDRFVNMRRGEDVRTLVARALYAYAFVESGERWEWVQAQYIDHMGTYRFRGAVSEDRPRFEPPTTHGCIHVLASGPRKGRECGRFTLSGGHPVITNPDTGEWRRGGWCRKHAAEGREVLAASRALTSVPEPLPNVGGILPSYLGPDTLWEELYRWAFPSWEPPYVGVVADDWPVLARVREAPRSKPNLTVVDGDPGGEDGGSGPPPRLRLV